MMLSLGLFVFGMDTAAYQELQRQTDWKHASTPRVGARDAYQFTGQGEDSITLSGWIAPELTGTIQSIEDLREMGDTGKAWVLVEGTGAIYGTYFIASLKEGKTEFYGDGTPRKVDFSLTLKRTDDDKRTATRARDQLGDLSGFAGNGTFA